jgi:glutaredoxin-like protein NrdH
MRTALLDSRYKEEEMITLYTKLQCPFCDNAKIWLEKNNLAYTPVNIMENDEALEFIKSKGHKTVPQIYFDGELFVEGGFTGLSKQDPQVLREQMEKNQ